MIQHGYIYRVTNLATGTTYVGQRRGEFRSWYLGSGKLIRRAVRKHGSSSFRLEFVQSAFDQASLDLLEKHFIALARSAGPTYNVRDGGLGSLFNGSGPMKGRKHRTQTRRGFSISRTGSGNPNFGKDLSGANNPHFGHKHSEETKRIIAENKRGTTFNRGKKRTAEQIGAMRARALKQGFGGCTFRSEETRRKISQALKGNT